MNQISKKTMTRAERKAKEYEDVAQRKEEEREEIEQQLQCALNFDDIKVVSFREPEDSEDLAVVIEFTINDYVQENNFYWSFDESIEQFAEKVKKRIDYIKELRQQYPEYCQQNDFIQTNSKFKRKLKLTHMGYLREYQFEIDLADYMKLPNTTHYGIGGGDYEVKRTPKRVKEYNQNIDKTIDFLIDCITDLKGLKEKKNEPKK